jgi:hypothetical protein
MKQIEAEGGEILLKNSHGDIVIIPKKDKNKIESLVNDGCGECIDSYVNTLPIMKNYAKDGSVIPKGSKIKYQDSKGNTSYIDINSPEYEEMYSNGQIATYDERSDTFIVPELAPTIFEAEPSELLKLRRKIQEEYTKDKFIDESLPKFSRSIGVSADNLAEGTLKQYEDNINNKIALKLLENKPKKGNTQENNVEWYNSFSEGEKEIIRNSQYSNKFLPAERAYEKSQGDKVPFGEGYTSTEKFKESGRGAGESFRLAPNAESNIEDYVNPFLMLGKMGQGIANTPQNIKEGNYGQAAIDIGVPLATGAIGGLGTKNVGQFLNNTFNPLAGTKDLVNNLGNKYLPNAHKLNPKAFKPNVDAYYRGLGKTGLEDAIEMGYLRSNKMGKFGDDLYLSSSFNEADHYSNNRIPWTILDDGSIVDDMSRASGIDTGKYFAEIPKKNVNAKPYHINDTQYITNETISLDKVRFLKEDWLKGYKEIEVPKSNFKSEIDWNNYLTPEQAAIARSERMLAQESKWNVNSNSYTKDKFTNVKDNFEEVFANEVDGNVKSLGVNKLGKAFVFKDNGLTSANQARIAAHEVGHFYRNLADEADEWNSFFDFSKLKSKTNNYLRGKPTAVKKSISNSKIDGINLKDRGVPHGDEIRERAAQLKDYIAQKNNIPLNKDFKISSDHLDDAIKNYVKDTGLDNSMSPMLNSLIDKKGFLKQMNKTALSTLPLGVIGTQYLKNQEEPPEEFNNGGQVKKSKKRLIKAKK